MTIRSAYGEAHNGHLTDDLKPEEKRRGEFLFFIDQAQKHGGGVLELASGAGRVLMPLAEAGIEVWGLEASVPMLDLARQAIAKNLSSEAQSRIHLVHGDMRRIQRALELKDQKFPLVIIPYCSFWWNFSNRFSFRYPFALLREALFARESFLDGKKQAYLYIQAEYCLKSILAALEPQGTFIIDTPYYAFEYPDKRDADLVSWWNTMACQYQFVFEIIHPYLIDGGGVVLIGKKTI